jgi:hypothetical protein
MTTILAMLAALADAAAWFLTARWLYGRWRAAAPTGSYGTPVPHGVLAAAAMAGALLWPIVFLTALVRVNPPRTQAEEDAELAAMKARRAAIDAERQATEESTAALRKASDDLERELSRDAVARRKRWRPTHG